MRPSISMSSILLLLVVMTGLASYASAYTCVITPFVNAACMRINYETGGLQGKGSRPGAPNKNVKFGCADGNVNTPLCCSKPFAQVQAGRDGSIDPSCIFAPQGPDRK